MRRLIFLILFSFCINFNSLASCNCPESTACDVCKGGIVSLTLRYVGSVAADIKIQDSKAVYFTGTVSPYQDITITGTKSNGKFETDVVDLLVNGLLQTNIDVNCGQAVFVNSTFGNFLVIAGESRQGGALCCNGNTQVDQPPVITNCPSDIEASINGNACNQIINWTAPLATDDCKLSSFTTTHVPGQQFPLGKTTVTYTAIDESNNKTTCSFNITINDKAKPVINNCPTDMQDSIFVKDRNVKDVRWTLPTATDNCGTALLTSTYDPGALFGVGSTVVVYTATDNAGNKSTCQFNVVITARKGEATSPLDIIKYLTPGANNGHDTWAIGHIEKYPKNKVIIFDRWGSLVFTTTGYDNSTKVWKGTNASGMIVPSGTYFYRIELNDGGSAVETGFIELIEK